MHSTWIWKRRKRKGRKGDEMEEGERKGNRKERSTPWGLAI